MLFRKFLIRIRKEYNTNRRKLFLYSTIISAVCLGLTFIVDFFLPFSGIGTIIRSILLIPTSAALFILVYALSLILHYSKMEDPEWVPFRSRFSPTWRRRISMIVAAILFVIMYANGTGIGYTALSSFIVMIVIALFAFMRLTKEEEEREKYDLPDARDVQYESRLKQLEENRRKAAQNKKERKEAEKQQ